MKKLPSKLATAAPAGPRDALCERVTATGTSPHHVRQLTDQGMFRGGGADGPAACGATVAWDTSEVTLEDIPGMVERSHASFRLCTACVAAVMP
ncbi:hypothetical protein [Frigoribacterium sp. MCBA15_019]|uniref:hypothetical protein n=1 Tax=Frigoribacterium sp. MCBA15_019 TaxID=1898745 RepID=UPI0008DDE428|nr:hypothetical protein [Frigoribacterium sp. MCBA15_019]OII27312.1 hypothetical protein BIV04_01765 [Frigoribacterium sp. MCBA15_019]